jgi:hypothetical protein
MSLVISEDIVQASGLSEKELVLAHIPQILKQI